MINCWSARNSDTAAGRGFAFCLFGVRKGGFSAVFLQFDPVGGEKKGCSSPETAGQFSLHPQKTTKNRKLEDSNFFFIHI